MYRRALIWITVAAVAQLGIATAWGQTVSKKSLTLDGAEQAIAAAKQYAKQNSAPGGVIAIVDEGGNLMALERIDGTFAAGANISIGKARTAVLFKKPTKFFEDIIRNGRTPMIALNDFTPLQGGVPILIDGEVVGGIGVSGAASQQQDEELAIAGANVFRTPGRDSMGSTMQTTTYFDSKTVSTAFEHGKVLLNGDDGRSYMIHASRRETPGQAEIHTKDTDIIYVVQGTATVVTGGQATDAKITEPNELRGSGISGGETRVLTKGDVYVIPNGVPHQFQKVTNPFLYYVVKAR